MDDAAGMVRVDEKRVALARGLRVAFVADNSGEGAGTAYKGPEGAFVVATRGVAAGDSLVVALADDNKWYDVSEGEVAAIPVASCVVVDEVAVVVREDAECWAVHVVRVQVAWVVDNSDAVVNSACRD